MQCLLCFPKMVGIRLHFHLLHITVCMGQEEYWHPTGMFSASNCLDLFLPKNLWLQRHFRRWPRCNTSASWPRNSMRRTWKDSPSVEVACAWSSKVGRCASSNVIPYWLGEKMWKGRNGKHQWSWSVICRVDFTLFYFNKMLKNANHCRAILKIDESEAKFRRLPSL